MEISPTRMVSDVVSLKSIDQQSKNILQAGEDLKEIKAAEQELNKKEDNNEKVQSKQEVGTGNPLNDKNDNQNIIDILG